MPDIVPEQDTELKVETGGRPTPAPQPNPYEGWEPNRVHHYDAVLADIYSGDYRESVPNMVELTGLNRSEERKFLLYEGLTHSLAGESGAGKSWFAAACAIQVLRTGGAVYWFDYEMSMERVLYRFVQLGLERHEFDRFVYIKPTRGFVTSLRMYEVGGDMIKAPGLSYARDVETEISEGRKVLAVIDSLGMSIALNVGATDNSSEDVIQWMNSLPQPLADAGAAVLILDHFNKSNIGGSYATGSHRKRGMTDVLFTLREGKNFTKHVEGYASLTVAKDRDGESVKDQRLVIMQVHVNPTRIELRYDAQTAAATQSGSRDKTRRDITNYLEAHTEGTTSTALRKHITGSHTFIKAQVEFLIEKGFITETPGKTRGTVLHASAPYDPESSLLVDAALLEG